MSPAIAKPERHPNGVPRTIHHHTEDGPVYHDEVVDEESAAAAPAGGAFRLAPAEAAPASKRDTLVAALKANGYTQQEAEQMADGAIAHRS